MFPGYLFVRDAMTKERYVEMLGVRGIVRVLEDGWDAFDPGPGVGHRRHPPHRRIWRRCISAPAPSARRPRACRWNGPLSGIEGIFVTDSQQKGRLVVTIDLLGRSVALEVSGEDVVRCN